MRPSLAAPLALLMATLTPLASSASEPAAPPQALTPVQPRPLGYGALFAAGSAVGAVSSAGGLLLGAALGPLTNSLAGALVLAGFTNLLLPPVFTAISLLLLGNLNAPGRFSPWLPMLGAFAVNGALYAVVSLALPFAVAWSNPVALVVYAAVAGLSMSGAANGIMRLTERPPVFTLRTLGPGPDEAVFASLTRVEL